MLLSTIGTSPAVLTETIWALAQLEEPIIPDEVVVVTTGKGAQELKKQLFSSDGESTWEGLKKALAKKKLDVEGKLSFGPVAESIRIPATVSKTNDLDDIVTTEDNFLLADFLIREIRKYTEDSGVQLLTSIAGGRKTMSALMLSCMSLLGRDYDHVLHVLVNPPYDGFLKPSFFYPIPKVKHEDREGKKYKSTDAKIELIDIPYVKTRGWYQEKFSKTPPSYTDLVNAVQSIAPKADVLMKFKFKFDFDNGRLLINDVDAGLNGVELVTFAIGIEYAPTNLYEELRSLQQGMPEPKVKEEWIDQFKKSSRFKWKDDEDNQTIPKLRNGIKNKLKKFKELTPYIDTIFPRGTAINKCPNIQISVDMKKLKKLLNCDKICGV